ncbi:MAG: DUF3667 domain-containing protein [Bacteroidales bacterium]|nr:DUF3667 domain-containing protein [Bacteroidales bacterium]
MSKKHSVTVRRRAFAIWQKLGYLPWRKPREARKKGGKDFYKGAFDSIPFLNDDAKRTFSHLLLRPGYMIRDYLGGRHDRYLAPLTSLIVFYAFFALIASVLQPIQHRDSSIFDVDSETPSEIASERGEKFAMNVLKLVQNGYTLLNLDRNPDQVDTRGEVALAALEGKLRSQGIPLFLGKFLLLWLSMSIVLRRYKISMSGAAAASAYVLCQFSFFMIFALLLSFGESTSISLLLMAVLLTIDYRQWLGLRWRESLGLVVRTSIFYGLMFLAVILTVSLLVTLVAWLKL